MYKLTNGEQARLIDAIRAIYAIPFIDDVEDYIWEAIFTYAKRLPSVDPLTNIRSKRLFDVVDQKQKIGWSMKAIQRVIDLPCEFEVVIQRADIIKKATSLGFDRLDLDSPTEMLGQALLNHWYEKKVSKDANIQGVEDKRICILLKSPDRKDYVYFEEELVEYKKEDLTWTWTDETKTGLQARRNKDNVLVFRWYPNQKQFFERFLVSSEAYKFSIEPRRLATDDIVELLLAKLEGRL